jgi:hypothetical protein
VRRGVLALLAACGLWLLPAVASAQDSRVEASVGLLWIGQQPLGSSQANETVAAGTTTPLFSTSSTLAGAAGIEGRIGVRLTDSLVAEAEGSYLKPQLMVAISGDTEGAAATTATETTQQVTIGGGVSWFPLDGGSSARFAPFVNAGAGYLRQLHDQNTLVQTGSFVQFGAGATYLLSTRRHFHAKSSGIRLDVHASRFTKGVAFDDRGRVAPAFGASLFVRF